MSKITRLQGHAFHSVKHLLRPISWSESEDGRIRVDYRDERNRRFCHWLNEEEIVEFNDTLRAVLPTTDAKILKPTFEPGDRVWYLPRDFAGRIYKVQPGIVKRMSSDPKYAFVWYHSGCTAASTLVSDLEPASDTEQHQDIYKGCVVHTL